MRRTAMGLVGLVLLLGSPAFSAERKVKEVPANHAERMKQGLALFQSQVRKVLIDNCLECHGAKKVRGDFDLSTRQSMLDSGMVGKDARSSRMIVLIRHAEEPHMPKSADKLPEQTIASIARWIDLGAPYDRPLVDRAASPQPAGPEVPVTISDQDRRFWSFQPLRISAPPAVANTDWVRTPIDQFILARLNEHGLTPNPPADRRTLLRRAYLDLLGLPPTPEEIDAFVNDPDPLAYEKRIDELLDSRHYGERWARHWMDVARFAESHGYEQDYDRPHAYPYRDFLIRAFNDDLPYDRFVRWQLAGDELAPDNPQALAATGFLGAGAFPTQLTEAEFESARYNELDDMVATTGVAFLGLSIGCARCHDHKYDPIPSHDYYRLAATFTTTIRSEIDLTLEPGQKPVKVQVTSEGFPHMKHHADGRGFPHFYPHTYFLQRGDVHQKQGEASPGFLQVLMHDKPESYWKQTPPAGWTRTSFRRASLASWITDPQYGAGQLLARVMVNRLWQHHLGQGIVATPNDFGRQGSPPTHPELLDWLATDLIHHGWKLKRLHRMIMTSAVYMQSNHFDEARARIDHENQFLWRWTPRRLEAEAIRDSLLSVAGMLDPTPYGPGSLDPNMRRRSIYFFIKRSQLIPMMMLFDWPEHLVSIGRRSNTTIAPQALLFLNSPQCRQYAEGFAKRLAGKSSTAAAIDQAYHLALGRAPSSREVDVSEHFLEVQAEAYRTDGKPQPEHLALVDFCQMLLSTNEFVYIQ
jgi:mono/diheme cytochrome c family protein